MRWRRQTPDDVRRREAQRAVAKGLSASRAGRFDEALAAFELAVELMPNLLEARVNLGSACYQRALTVPPADARPLLERAADQFRFVLGLMPDQVAASLNLAAALNALGERDEALALLEALAHSHPTHRDVHYNLAVARLQHDDPDGARAALSAELAHHADNPHALALQRRLDENYR